MSFSVSPLPCGWLWQKVLTSLSCLTVWNVQKMLPQMPIYRMERQPGAFKTREKSLLFQDLPSNCNSVYKYTTASFSFPLHLSEIFKSENEREKEKERENLLMDLKI